MHLFLPHICQQLRKREAVADELDTVQNSVAALIGSSWDLAVLCLCRYLIKEFSPPFLMPPGLAFAKVFTEVNCLPVLQSQYYGLCITKSPICINCISGNFCKVTCAVILCKYIVATPRKMSQNSSILSECL